MKNRHYNFITILQYSILAISIIIALIVPVKFGTNFCILFFTGTIWVAIINSAFLIARICDKLEEVMHHHIDVNIVNDSKEDSR